MVRRAAKNYHWDVSYEVFVPRRADLSLETQNGGISIAEVNGRIDFTALNGGVVLKRVGGAVRGSTTNGGLVIELSGDRWDGESLDVSTTNGGVIMSVPENYSANLQTGTVNGSVNVDFPVTVQGRIYKADCAQSRLRRRDGQSDDDKRRRSAQTGYRQRISVRARGRCEGATGISCRTFV